ncbi:MAG: hypothetical protein KAR47_14095 [Planctomycetes bacterium]|nr:hypothetical protein [Planctomycetota bacterium]
MEVLKLLYDFFPLAVYTGKCLVFISDEWRIELTEHKNTNFGQPGEQLPLIRVRIFQKALGGDFIPGHYEDFQLDSVSELATQIERYIQFAVGKNIRENV